MRPFLKWPGGKYKLVSHIDSLLQKGDRLIEPFVGSGAVFLNTEYDSYLLADINEDLIVLYQTLQKEGQAFIDYCSEFFTSENNTEERYYELRDEFNNTTDKRRKSAIFLYANKHGYNGLVRYNSSGKFNVPFGRYKKPYFPEKEMLFFYEKSKRATFICSDFRDTMAKAQIGDVIYCDPPYVPLSETAHFTSYSTGGFRHDDQVKLADLAKEISHKQIPVLISNHETEFTLNAYKMSQITSLEVQRNISCNGKKRGKAKEILALFSSE